MSSRTAASAAPTREGMSVAWNGSVLEAERDVAADGGGDDPRAGLLQDQPDGAGARMRWLAVDGDAAGEVAGVRRLEDSGERAQQRRLARPAGADQQHALPRGDDQVEVGEDGLAAAVGARSAR